MFYWKYWDLLKCFETALIMASNKGNTDVVRKLLSVKEININLKDIHL